MLRTAFLTTNLKSNSCPNFPPSLDDVIALIKSTNPNGNGKGNSEEIGDYNYDKLTFELSQHKTIIGPIYIEHAKNCIAQVSTL